VPRKDGLAVNLQKLSFVEIPAGEHELGWRFTSLLSDEARKALEEFVGLDTFLTSFSLKRKVSLSSFEIATTPVHIEEVLGEDIELEVETLAELCDLLDDTLRENGLRLATEDEIEAASGPGLFAWGNEIPVGEPHEGRTSFRGHTKPTPNGIQFNSDTYAAELVRTAYKLGDGGASVCGAYPWPVAWLSLATCWQTLDNIVEDCFGEFAETANLRLVKAKKPEQI
jgi:hypothetical protein